MARKKSNYLNRELSWLEFNARVLEEARDPRVPLLERLKFLAITASNLDEFFRVRVGGLQMLSAQGSTKRDPSGMTPDQQLEAICRSTHAMVAEQYACFQEELEPELAAVGIRRVQQGELTEEQTRLIVEVFEKEIFPILTPMAVDSPATFPLLAGRTLNILVRLKPGPGALGKSRFAVIPFGPSGRRFIALTSQEGRQFILIEDLVTLFADMFFPGHSVAECVPFRITRNADMSVREDMASDLLSEMEEVLDERRRSSCVRLEVAELASQTSLNFLQRALKVADADIYSIPGPIDFSDFMELGGAEGFEAQKYKSWPPRPSVAVDPGVSMFENLRRKDILISQPYESFEPVVRLLEEAAEDPEVLAIKQILYRTSRNSPIVAALMRAAQKGKYVTAIVELKARFDEARNIEWARALEDAGVQVIYGVKGLKTHAKLLLIIRREPHGIQRYVHVGTGNYNEVTARLYSDISYMTCNPDLATDGTSFFNAITGYSQPQHYRLIEAAPISLREKIVEMIESETERKRQGQKARIVAKVNSLADPQIIDALYRASQAGVKIQLNVRGICCLRPGVPKLSDNITVISIVDRFLEHSRIFYFYQGGGERVFISSADWMPRNLDRRVELLTPIVDPACRDELVSILETYFRDTVKARRLLPDGSYERVRAMGRRKKTQSQEALYQRARDAERLARRSRRTVFEPHRPPGTKS